MDLVEVLSFLLMLSTMELGQDYSTENLSPTQLTMLEDLRDYGLVWQRKVGSLVFFFFFAVIVSLPSYLFIWLIISGGMFSALVSSV